MKSMEDNVLEVFFDYPSKQWHFRELARTIGLAQSKLDRWLKIFQKDKLILRIKEKGKMPHYISNFNHPSYQHRKRIFALNKLYSSGLLVQLSSLKDAENIVLFGSFSRSDWYKDSDIDIFIYGNPEGLNVGKYERQLQHNIQLFICKNKRDIDKFGSGLLRNVIKGISLKGLIPQEVLKNACL